MTNLCGLSNVSDKIFISTLSTKCLKMFSNYNFFWLPPYRFTKKMRGAKIMSRNYRYFGFLIFQNVEMYPRKWRIGGLRSLQWGVFTFSSFVLSQQILLVESPQWARKFLFFTALRPVQVPNHTPSQWLSPFFPRSKRPKCETTYWSPSIAKELWPLSCICVCTLHTGVFNCPRPTFFRYIPVFHQCADT